MITKSCKTGMKQSMMAINTALMVQNMRSDLHKSRYKYYCGQWPPDLADIHDMASSGILDTDATIAQNPFLSVWMN